MNSDTRACIVYIAARLILRRRAASIFDLAKSQHLDMDGDISDREVRVYDHGRSCYISGQGQGGRYDLHDESTRQRVDLLITGVAGDKFEGYDYGTEQRFRGEVQENRIFVYDDEHSQYFNYRLGPVA